MVAKVGVIAIGVSNYASAKLRNLPGAKNGANSFIEWAPSNYKKLLIDDTIETVTTRRLQNEIEPFLNGNRFHRLFVYFSGHGLVKTDGSQFWLLPGVEASPREAIHVPVFLRQIHKWNIQQVAVFADACRTLETLGFDVNGDGILSNSGAVQRNVQRDMFLATSLGDPSYSIAGELDADHFCVFTDVLLNALRGEYPSAIREDHHPQAPAIISDSLADCLLEEVPKRALDFDREMTPEIQANFRYPNDVYAKTGGSLDAPSPIGLPEGISDAVPPPNAGHSRTGPIGVVAMGEGELFAAEVSETVEEFRQRYALDFQELMDEFRKELAANALPSIEFLSNKPIAGFALPADIGALDVLKSGDAYALVVPRGEFNYERMGRPILAKTEGDYWALVPQFEDQFPTSLPSFGDDLFMVPRNIIREQDVSWTARYVNPHLPAGLKIGDALSLADTMRYEKHQVPIKGVKAAYLYEFAGDYDNITRIAHYYAKYDQGIPFDIALLAGDVMRWAKDEQGRYRATVDLRGIAANTADDGVKRPGFAKSDMQQRDDAPVSGLAPMLKQGWAFLQTISHEGLPQGYIALEDEVVGDVYTAFSDKGAQMFSQVFGYHIENEEAAVAVTE